MPKYIVKGSEVPREVIVEFAVKSGCNGGIELEGHLTDGDAPLIVQTILTIDKDGNMSIPGYISKRFGLTFCS
jgi:hypothetical protein